MSKVHRQAVTVKVRSVKTVSRKTVTQGGKVRTVERVRLKREATRTTVRPRKPQGVILYRGPSLLDGSPIVCVAVGLTHKSKNPKTGQRTVQTFILADNGEDPIAA